MRNAFGLADKVCVITGAAGGIGRGTALAFAREGARLALLDSNEAGVQETAQLVRDLGAEALAVACDTSRPESVEVASRAVTDRFSGAEVLVNNAAILGSGGLADLSLADWNRVLAVNLTGYFICSQVFGRPMLLRGQGALVHVSSVTAQQTTPRSGNYPIAKAGVSMMSRLLAAEWGPSGVRSNSVLPGLVQTPMTQGSYNDARVARGRAELIPLARVARADDIVGAVLFLASPRAGYVNGAELLVDGGLVANLMSVIPRTGSADRRDIQL